MLKKGLTLVEIIISMLILSLVMLGLANLFTGVKRHILHTRSRTIGGELGKHFLDPLQMHVRQAESSAGAQDGWDQPNNALRIGDRTDDDQDIGGITYTPTYEINDFLDGKLRKVVLHVKWREPSP